MKGTGYIEEGTKNQADDLGYKPSHLKFQSEGDDLNVRAMAPLQEKLETQEGLIGELQSVLLRLQDKLEPISVLHEKTKDGAVRIDETSSSRIVSILRSNNNELNRLIGQIRLLTEGLEV